MSASDEATGRTRPDANTRSAEREDAQTAAGPDDMPTPEQEQVADSLKPDPKVSEEYEEAIERGANAKGEGRIP